MKSVAILGRQPALGLAELESLYGASVMKPVASGAALLDVDSKDIDFKRLGGSIKLARTLTIIDGTDWADVEAHLSEHIPEHLRHVPAGKFRLGLSVYGLKVRPAEINASGLRLKKIIKAEGRSVRIVPNKSAALNSAQVLHNNLASPTGWELVAVRFGQKTVLALTVAEQDIEAYARRDQNRPKRDARVGMLPPKLAQIIINLANPSPGGTVLDPFCGTGVLLQEALLMGFKAYGTDVEPRMTEYANANLEWLDLPATDWRLETADARTHTWQPPFDNVAGETYLGRPLASLPQRRVMDQIAKDCDDIHAKFLANIAKQLPSGARLCLAVPAWRTKNAFLHLKTLDRLADLGYTRLSFVHAKTPGLIYHRPDQIVARELVVLVKK